MYWRVPHEERGRFGMPYWVVIIYIHTYCSSTVNIIRHDIECRGVMYVIHFWFFN